MEGLNVIDDLDTLVEASGCQTWNTTDPCGSSRRIDKTSPPEKPPVEESQSTLASLQEMISIIEGEFPRKLEDYIKQTIEQLIIHALVTGKVDSIRLDVPNRHPIYKRKFIEVLGTHFPFLMHKYLAVSVLLYFSIEDLLDYTNKLK